MTSRYSPDDYDAKGLLRLPVGFWLTLLLQARTWVLFVMAGASRDQGATLLELFYPDSHTFWTGLALGIPAALGLLLTGYRARFPLLWQYWRGVLCLALVAMMVLQGISLWRNEDALSPLVIVVTGFDLLALGYLMVNPRLRDCFSPELQHG